MSSLQINQIRRRELACGLLLMISASFWFISAITQFDVASAQELVPTPISISDDQVNAIARDMYCPVCENVPLDVCSTQACAEWRELIRDKLANGWSEEQIGEYFIERFGDRVSSTPPLHGFNWLVYLIPPLVFISASVFLFRTIRKPSHRNETDIRINSELNVSRDEYEDRLEEELRKF
jgi:cytochrome c-type biogenesis protein CcmH